MATAEDYRRLFDEEKYQEARRLEMSPDEWRRVLNWGEPYARFVSVTKQLPDEIIRELAESDSWRPRADIAMKRATPNDILRDFADTGCEIVRKEVALNATTPDDVLEVLTDDDVDDIAEAARERLESDS